MAVARLASLCAVPSLASTSEGIEAGNRGSKCCSFRNSGFFGATLEMVANEQRSHKATRSARASSEQEEMFQLPATHKIKAASLAALEQLRNAGANRYTSEKASILVIGLSVHTAPVEMREKLAIPEAEWPRAIEELCKNNHIEEAAVLSTCNRMEIYVVALSWHRGVKEVEEWMSKISGISNNELREHLFILRERDATEHLFRVASGLDSLVLGEGQILAQVKQVYLVGQDAKGFGRNLGGLFKHAITAGKRVRSETSIAAGAVSVSSAAVELAHLKLSDKGFSAARVLIVGAGKMSKLLVKHLISKGCNSMVIVNRTEKRVSDLRKEFDEAELIYQPLEQMFKCAGEADIIFTSTASDHPLFLKEHVDGLPPASESVGYTRHFIDISVPRNVSSCVAELPSTRVYNVDDLKDVVAANKEERKKKAMEAQVIIRQEMGSFEDWRDSLQTVPTIKKLREYAERIRASELEKSLSKMSSDMSKKDRKQIEDLTRAIVNKLLHGPMQHLRSDGNNSRTVAETLENMHALERMFDLKSEISAIEQRLKIESQSRSQ